jgi:hypothetical protein
MKNSHIILLVAAALALYYFAFLRKKTTETVVNGTAPVGADGTPLVPQAMQRPGRLPLGQIGGRVQWYRDRKQAVKDYWAGGGTGGGCTFIESNGQYGVQCP